MRPGWRVALWIALVAGACSPRPAAPPRRVTSPPVVQVEPTPSAPARSPVATADAAADAAPEPADDGRTRVLDVTQVPLQTAILDGQLAPQPCDLERSYRGSVGNTPLTVLLVRRGGLGGEVHYDNSAPSLALTSGSASGAAVHFSERGGGSFDGECDASTGRIAGTYSLKGKAQRFELWPRPADWPPLYRVTRETTVAGNYPGCARVHNPDQTVTVPIPGSNYAEAVCPPKNPAARRQAILGGGAVCAATDVGLRVFGVPNAAALNRVLASATGYAQAVRDIKKCWNVHSYYSSTGLMHAGGELLVIQNFVSEDWGGAHPMNSTDSGVAIDRRTARVIRLADVVTDTDKLRDLARRCAWDYFAVEGIDKTGRVRAYPPDHRGACDDEPLSYLMWDCDPNAKTKLGPEWGLFDEGVAVLTIGYPHVMQALDGRGPIIGWAALARAGILKPGSPVARLWSGVKPAPDGAPACTSAFAGEPTLVRWTVVDPGK